MDLTFTEYQFEQAPETPSEQESAPSEQGVERETQEGDG